MHISRSHKGIRPKVVSDIHFNEKCSSDIMKLFESIRQCHFLQGMGRGGLMNKFTIDMKDMKVSFNQCNFFIGIKNFGG